LAERTAALKEPYNDDSNTKGKLFYTQEELKTLVTRLHKANFPVIIHAMGDQALDMTVTILEKILNEYPKKDHRYRIEQAAVLNKDLIKRIKRLGVSVGVQPCTIISEFTAWSAVARLGEERARLLYPLKTLLKEFIPVIGGSDCPMELINPFLGIKAAVTRHFFPKEQIAVGDALRMYTVNAAYASFDENLKGTIDEGKLADLTVISCDPTTILPSQLDDIQVEMTIIGGKIVYSKEKFLVYST
jgi:predicted amidohydrolase YtcJ